MSLLSHVFRQLILTLTQQKKAAEAAQAPSTSASVQKKLPPTVAANSSKPSKSSASSASAALDSVKFKHPPEDAEALAIELIPSNIVTDLGNSNWKTRLAALEEMTTWLEEIIQEVDSEVVVRFLGKRGWNEKNFQVNGHYPIFVGLFKHPISGFSKTVWSSGSPRRRLPFIRTCISCFIDISPQREIK